MFKDKLFKGSAILFIGSMIANVCNYLFQFFMSRNLSVTDFGTMNALLSLLVITAVPSVAIMLVSSKQISIFKATNEIFKTRLFHKKVFKKISIYGVFITLFLIALSPQIADYLNIYELSPVILLLLILFFSFLIPINLGIIQGLQHFITFGVLSGITGLARLLFGIILLTIGFKLNGAMMGILFSIILVFSISFFYITKAQPKIQDIQNLGIGYKNILLSSLPIVLCTLGILGLTNLDLILVKHYFSGEEAGIYASVAVLGRTIFYFPGIIVLAMFPMASENHALKTNSLPLLKKTLGLTFMMAGTGLIILLVFPDLMLSILFGKTYSDGGTYLRIFSIAMFFMAMVSILANYFLAVEKKQFLWILIAGCFIEVILICFFHQSLMTVLYIITVTTSLMFISLLLMTLGLKKPRTHNSGSIT